MGLGDFISDKVSSASESMKYSDGSTEDAIKHISYKIAEEVEKGEFDQAKNILKQHLDELMAGEMKTESFRHGNNPNVKWDTPEEEAQFFVNEVYLFLLEMAVKDLEGIDSHLEPPIRTTWIRWDDGLLGKTQKLQEMNRKAIKAYPDETQTVNIDENTPKWYIEEYLYYGNWSEERPSYNTLKNGIKGKVTRWKWIAKTESKLIRHFREILGTDQEEEHENNGDSMIFQHVIRTKRRIRFIEKLAKWEQSEYGLEIDNSELEEISQVGGWVEEREKVIRKLDELLSPYNGEGKFEAWQDLEKAQNRFQKVEEVVKELREMEGEEDEKLKQLEQKLP